MRSTFFLAASSLTGALAWVAQVPAQTLHYYRFESGTADQPTTGPVIDSGPRASHGTPAGGPTHRSSVARSTIPATGATNLLSLDFDGADDRVQVASQFPFHQPGDVTVEFFLHSPMAAHQAVLWTRPDSTDANRFHFYVNTDSTFGFDYRSTDGTLHLLVGGGADGGIMVPRNTWMHLAITRAGDTYRIYKNGGLVRTAIDASPDLPTSTGWQMSGRRPGDMFRGQLDELRISAGALVPGQFLIDAVPRWWTLGQGCGGSANPPRLDAVTLPRLGRDFTLRTSSLPVQEVGVLYWGFRDDFFGLPLPVDLTAIGLPNCLFFTSGEFGLPFSSGALGVYDSTVGVPTDSALSGLQFRNQVLVRDRSVGPIGINATNGGEGVLGT